MPTNPYGLTDAVEGLPYHATEFNRVNALLNAQLNPLMSQIGPGVAPALDVDPPISASDSLKVSISGTTITIAKGRAFVFHSTAGWVLLEVAAPLTFTVDATKPNIFLAANITGSLDTDSRYTGVPIKVDTALTSVDGGILLATTDGTTVTDARTFVLDVSNWRTYGDYNSSATYPKNAIVRFGGQFYLSRIDANLNHQPDTSTAQWYGIGIGGDADTLQGQNGAYYRNRTNHTGTQTASTISDFDNQVHTSRLDQMASPTGAVSFNSQKITNLATPTTGTDATNKTYVDSAISALSAAIEWLPPVRLATTTNDSLSGLAARDGVTPVAGNRVLVINQTDATQNGPYVAASGAWTRTGDTLAAGAAVVVTEGTANGDKIFLLTTNNPITVGATALAWLQIGMGSSYSFTAPLVNTSGTISAPNATSTAAGWMSPTDKAYLDTLASENIVISITFATYAGLLAFLAANPTFPPFIAVISGPNPSTTVTANYTVLASDREIIGAETGNITVTLLSYANAAAARPNYSLEIFNAPNYTITLQCASGENIISGTAPANTAILLSYEAIRVYLKNGVYIVQ